MSVGTGLHNHKSLEGMYVTKTRGKFFQLLIRSDVQCTYSHCTCILEKRVSTMYNVVHTLKERPGTGCWRMCQSGMVMRK